MKKLLILLALSSIAALGDPTSPKNYTCVGEGIKAAIVPTDTNQFEVTFSTHKGSNVYQGVVTGQPIASFTALTLGTKQVPDHSSEFLSIILPTVNLTGDNFVFKTFVIHSIDYTTSTEPSAIDGLVSKILDQFSVQCIASQH